MRHKLFVIFLVFYVFIFLSTGGVQAFTVDNKYPRTANYYLKSGWSLPKSDYGKLVKYDLVILPMEAQAYNRDFFSFARSQNPDIIILPYIPSRSINILHIDDGAGLRKKLLSGIQEDWYLRDPQSNKLSAWVGTRSINITSDWKEYLPKFVNREILSTGLWDGIFYDEVDAYSISWLNNGNIDYNQDGEKDHPGILDAEWRKGMTKLFKNTRKTIGNQYLIIINGSSLPEYQSYINGRMFESFPTPWEGGKWQGIMFDYQRLSGAVREPETFVINSNTNNTGRQNDYQKMRFGLTSALLQNGFSSFDYGDQDHGQLWWYDEYDVPLGGFLEGPRNIDNSSLVTLSVAGLWQREFEQGLVMVNSSDRARTISLNSEFEKIKGVQDRKINNGQIISSITLAPDDGVILLKRASPSQVIGQSFPNGAYAKIYDYRGNNVRQGFFTYEQNLSSSANVILSDMDGDGGVETLIAEKGKVKIYRGGRGRDLEFDPYYPFKISIKLAVCDLDGDGQKEILTSPQSVGGPHIRVFSYPKLEMKLNFFAFEKRSSGGASVACGDLDGDGRPEIVVGSGNKRAPEVKIFSNTGKVIHGGFLAYAPDFRRGVDVAVGDLDGDGKGEIVTGPNTGGGPHVRIFYGNGHLRHPGFFPYSKTGRAGVSVAVADLDGDGKGEILAMTKELFSAR